MWRWYKDSEDEFDTEWHLNISKLHDEFSADKRVQDMHKDCPVTKFPQKCYRVSNNSTESLEDIILVRLLSVKSAITAFSTMQSETYLPTMLWKYIAQITSLEFLNGFYGCVEEIIPFQDQWFGLIKFQNIYVISQKMCLY
jgi:hypothetical protein